MKEHRLTRQDALYLAVILLFIFVTRLPYINNSPAEAGELWREADTESIARNFIKYPFSIFPQFNYDGTPPNFVQLEFQVTTLLIAGLYRIFGVHYWLARLVPLSFFMLSTYFLYRLAARIYTSPQALAVGLVYAVLPLSLFFSRAIMPEPALLCFYIAGYYYFVKWLNDERFGTLMRAAVCTCLAVSQKPPVAFVGLAMLVLCVGKYKQRVFKQWQLYVFAAVALIPPAIYFIAAKNVADVPFVSRIASRHLLPDMLSSFASPVAAAFYKDALPRAFTLPFLVFAALGFLFSFRRQDRPILWLSLAMLLEVAAVVSVIKFMYYLMLFVPVVALLSGKFLGVLWHKTYTDKILLLSLLAVMFIKSYQQIEPRFVTESDYIRGAAIINKYTKPGDLTVVSTFEPALLSLSDRAGWRANLAYYGFIPVGPAPEVTWFIRNGADYFLVFKNSINGDDGSYLRYLDAHYNKKQVSADFTLYLLHEPKI
jgi:4-amino-4-deoxy-L-arabinose transferase-like glycosyltransferase